jgi:glutathione-specific gamma-glutamylcyclotransferase
VGAQLYLFGYGSLIWKHDELRAASSTWGRIENWSRRFWHASPDHRGTHARPGCVATIVEEAGGSTVGKVFRIAADDVPSVLGPLLWREKAGYGVRVATAECSDGSKVRVWFFAGPPAPAPRAIEDIASDVSTCVGASGANAEYFWNLYRAIQAEGIADDHLDAIAAALCRRGCTPPWPLASMPSMPSALHASADPAATITSITSATATSSAASSAVHSLPRAL